MISSLLNIFSNRRAQALRWLRSWFSPHPPMMRHPGYAVLTREIAARRKRHQPVQDLLDQRRELLHRALGLRAEQGRGA